MSCCCCCFPLWNKLFSDSNYSEANKGHGDSSDRLSGMASPTASSPVALLHSDYDVPNPLCFHHRRVEDVASRVFQHSDIPHNPSIPQTFIPIPKPSDIPQGPSIPQTSVPVPQHSDIPHNPSIPQTFIPIPKPSDIPQGPSIPQTSVPVPQHSDIQQKPSIPQTSVVPVPQHSDIQQKPSIPQTSVPVPQHADIQQEPLMPQTSVPVPQDSFIQRLENPMSTSSASQLSQDMSDPKYLEIQVFQELLLASYMLVPRRDVSKFVIKSQHLQWAEDVSLKWNILQEHGVPFSKEELLQEVHEFSEIQSDYLAFFCIYQRCYKQPTVYGLMSKRRDRLTDKLSELRPKLQLISETLQPFRLNYGLFLER